MINAFAYHKIITDTEGKPVDYEYIDVNQTFTDFTGLARENVIGKRITEINPEVVKDKFNWIEFFGKIALGGGTANTLQYSEALDNWYEINVFSPEKGYFVAIFNNVTEVKNKEREFEKTLSELKQLYEESNALYESLAITDEELRRQNEELINKNYEISKMHKELTASDEELQQQFNELNKLTEQLARSREIYKLVSEASNDAIWYIDYRNKEKYFSEKWYKLLGYKPQEMTDPSTWHNLIHPEDKDIAFKHYSEHIEKKTPHYRCEYRIKHKNGSYVWVLATGKALFDTNGKPYLIAGSHTDITEHKNSQDMIRFMAYHDSLTGLPNRLLLMDHLTMVISMAGRNSKKAAVVFLDIDNFKEINDTVGHDTGDMVLKVVADRLRVNIRNYETLARMGGDEFAIVIQDMVNKEFIYNFCERIRIELQKPIEYENNVFNISISMGVAVFPDDGHNCSELVKNADVAMYKAKAAGKNNVQFFNGNIE